MILLISVFVYLPLFFTFTAVLARDQKSSTCGWLEQVTFMGGCLSCHLTNSLKALNGNQSTDANQVVIHCSSSFLDLSADCWRKGCCTLYASSSLPVLKPIVVALL